MTLKRFKNELILLIALFFVFFAYAYKHSAKSYVNNEKQNIQKSIEEISKVSALKKLWGDKKIGKKLNRFKTIVSKEKLKSFEKRSRKMSATYQNLTVKELNTISKNLFKTPIKIIKLSITKTGKERYRMEFKCKW